VGEWKAPLGCCCGGALIKTFSIGNKGRKARSSFTRSTLLKIIRLCVNSYAYNAGSKSSWLKNLRLAAVLIFCHKIETHKSPSFIWVDAAVYFDYNLMTPSRSINLHFMACKVCNEFSFENFYYTPLDSTCMKNKRGHRQQLSGAFTDTCKK